MGFLWASHRFSPLNLSTASSRRRLRQVWEEVLQSWPDVAQKLRPASRCEVECSDVPSLEVVGGKFGGQQGPQ